MIKVSDLLIRYLLRWHKKQDYEWNPLVPDKKEKVPFFVVKFAVNRFLKYLKAKLEKLVWKLMNEIGK